MVASNKKDGGRKMPQQPLNTISRCLTNIGLTLQFYIPFVGIFSVVVMIFWHFIGPTEKPEVKGADGFVLAFAVIMAIVLIGMIITYYAYLSLNDRKSPQTGLIFLIVVSHIVGGFWLFCSCLSGMSANDHYPWYSWMCFPFIIIVPIILYSIALFLYKKQ